MNNFDARQFQGRLEHLDSLLREAETAADPAVQTHSRALVQALLELHSVGLERLLERIADAGETGNAILDACGRDDVVSGLLLLHNLHPHDLEARLHQALEGVRPYLRSHGGNVELLGVDNGLVTLRLHGSCQSYPSSLVTMRQTIEEAIYAKAPEVTAIEVDGLSAAMPFHENDPARVALPMV